MDATTAARLRTGVQQAYSMVATTPRAKHPFPVGRPLALNVGYARRHLDQLPVMASASFAGVSAVPAFAQLSPGATVLDLGCGAGLDSLLAAPRVGPTGRVIGLDFSAAMVACATANAAAVGLRTIDFVCGDAERLPLADGTIETALINGIFNLNPARAAIFAELARVVRPGGAVFSAEIILRKALPPHPIANDTDWFA